MRHRVAIATAAALALLALAPATPLLAKSDKPYPRMAGALPEVEDALLQALQGAGLTDRVLLIAADTNGDLTVAALVFSFRGRPADDPTALRTYAWRLVRTAFASVSLLDEVHLTAVNQDETPSQGKSPEVIFTAAISRSELQNLHPGPSPSAEFGTLPRAWYSGVTPTPEIHGADTEPAPFLGTRSSRPSGQPVRDLYRGDPSRRTLAITFDDGPFPIYTTLLLDTLDRLSLKATFFLVGDQVEQYPYFAQAIARAGHEIANHAFHHVNLTHLSPSEMLEDLARAQEIITAVTARTPKYFRPPGGQYSAALLRAAHSLGLMTVFWTANSGDYTHLGSRALEAKILARVSNGGILLLHQGVPNTIRILPQTTAILRQRGYTMTTVGGLLAPRGMSRRHIISTR